VKPAVGMSAGGACSELLLTSLLASKSLESLGEAR
jgi:hypothetical protein